MSEIEVVTCTSWLIPTVTNLSQPSDIQRFDPVRVRPVLAAVLNVRDPDDAQPDQALPLDPVPVRLLQRSVHERGRPALPLYTDPPRGSVQPGEQSDGVPQKVPAPDDAVGGREAPDYDPMR
uniref:(northern house mosquito) hypothetical protein n=1 Tax=Culex pipiens TaxID=7175 RepID=A0A8D8C213_CULPI